MTNLLEVDWSKIPAPIDDGGSDHLLGARIPSLKLNATSGEVIDLSRLPGRTVLYAYPMTGRPDVALPDGWDLVPGARGCTPQSCAFSDQSSSILKRGVSRLFGISAQETSYQQEAANRLHLTFPLLSDSDLLFQKALNLPTMQVESMLLLKRITLIIDDGQVSAVFYPVFPPDQSATKVLEWLG